MSQPMTTRTIDAFISHASEDLAQASAIAAVLERAGWSVFLAARDLPAVMSGVHWGQRIDEALEQCGVLVLLVSPEALTKRWVQYEWRAFHNNVLSGRAVSLIPLCVREISPAALRLPLQQYQAVDLRSAEERERGISSMLVQLESHLGSPIKPREAQAGCCALALGGQGVRSVLVLHALNRLESETCGRNAGAGTPFPAHFDLILGSGWGALLAGMLAVGMSHSERAACVETIFPDILHLSLLRAGWKGSKYSADRLRIALEGIFGDRALLDAPRLALNTFDARGGRHLVWSSAQVESGALPNVSLARLVAACMSVPNFFDPVRVSGTDGNDMVLLDGTFWSADPGLTLLESLRQFLVPTPRLMEMTLVAVNDQSTEPRTLDDASSDAFSGLTPIIQTIRMLSVALHANASLSRGQLLRQFQLAGAIGHLHLLDPAVEGETTPGHDELSKMPMLADQGQRWSNANAAAIAAAAEAIRGAQARRRSTT